MSEPLVVNPYLQLHSPADEGSALHLIAPRPGHGLRTMTVSRSTHANLFEVFTDLAGSSFSFLDPQHDITGEERDLLIENGILVSSDAAPEQPLFACQLADVVGVDGLPGELKANPTLRFEPFDLTNFAVRANEMHLSPHQPSAWVRSPVTDIEMGYWLSPDEAAVVAGLTAGAPIRNAVDPDLLRRLFVAEIVVSSGGLAQKQGFWNEEIEAAKAKFSSDKYAILRGLFPPVQMESMRRFYRRLVDGGFMPFGDPQVETRYKAHNEPLAAFLHGQLKHLISRVVGEEVKLSYVYAASYMEGSILEPHIDREQCEFSISFQVDYQPEPEGHLSPWAIFVEPLSKSLVKEHVGNIAWDQLDSTITGVKPASIHLASGDGLIYKGRELVHYRDALPAGHRSTSLFFHYVPMDFQGDLH